MRAWRFANASLVIALMLAATSACGSSASTGKALSHPQPGQATITIKNFTFTGDLSVTSGQRVTVHNRDSTTHTLTSDAGAFTTGHVAPGGTATLVAPTKPGRYGFHCEIHNYMQATLTVTG
jgi:plastocyanin